VFTAAQLNTLVDGNYDITVSSPATANNAAIVARRIGALAVLSPRANAAAIPTLGQWPLALLMLMLAGAAAMRTRRRMNKI
jgi:flavoprotein